MPESPQVAAMTPEQRQGCVDRMAGALAKAEQTLEDAIVAIGFLPGDIQSFHRDVGTHVTYVDDPLALTGQGMAAAGEALQKITAAHKALDALRKVHKLPGPDIVILNGGGGCKPNC